MSVHQMLHRDADGEWLGTDCNCALGEDHDRSIWSVEDACPKCEQDWSSHGSDGRCGRWGW